jgi:hypothetical protein
VHRLRALVLLLGTATGLYAAHPDQRSFLDSLLAVPYQSMVGDLSVSYHALHRALPIARQLNDPNAEGRLCGRLSVVHHLLNQLDRPRTMVCSLWNCTGPRVIVRSWERPCATWGTR